MTTVNDISDILRIIRERPEWADALRAALLSQELLELPQRFAESEIRFAEFAAAVDKRFAALEGSVGNLRGHAYEQKVGNNIASIARQHLGLRRIRVLKGYKTPDETAFHDLMDTTEDQGIINEQQRIAVGNADIILQGQTHPEQSNTYVALEVSITVADQDINRAAARANILEKATGMATLPAVICAHADGARQRLARNQSVTLITVAE